MPNFKEISRHTAVILTVTFVAVLSLSLTGFLPAFFNLTYLFFFVVAVNVCFLALKIKSMPEKERENSKLTYFCSHLFILLLIVIAVNQFAKLEQVTALLPELTALAIGSGFLTFYSNRDRVEQELEDEKQTEEKAEEKRKEEFAKQFPTIAKIPILRSIVKWMYKEGWWYSLIVVFLLVVGFYIRVYKLGDLSLWWDEIYTGTYVTRIIEIGLPISPSGLEYYWRGVAYHYIVSFFVLIFGQTEFWVRFTSVLFGIGIVILSFIFAKKINKNIALLVLIFLVFSTYNIEYSRFARFYVMNAFLFMLAVLFVYNYLFLNNKKYFIPSIIIFILMVYTVQLGGFFIFPILVFILYVLFFFNEREKLSKQKIIFIVLSFLILVVGNIFERLNFFANNNKYAYAVIDQIVQPIEYPLLKVPDWTLFTFLNQYYLPIFLCLISIFFGISMFFNKAKKKDSTIWFGFLGTVFFTSVIIFEIINRNVFVARIYLIFESLFVILSIFTLYASFRFLINRKYLSNLFIILILLLLIFSITPNFYSRINTNYGDNLENDPFKTTEVAKYRSDYKTTFEYVDEHSELGDQIIVVMTSNYFNLNKNPDYILNQNIRWNTR